MDNNKMNETLTNEVNEILSDATIENNTVKLNCGQIDRSTYEKVDNVLKRLWGKWVGRKKLHQFSYDPTDAIQAYLESGELPPKNATAYFPTPDIIVDEIVRVASASIRFDEISVLEPSAGQGALADAIKKEFPKSKITTVEYLELNASILKKKGYSPIVDDFMEVEFNEKFDLIIMNPPFSLATDKKAYITHIMKAHSLLKPDGTLLAITPLGWTFNDADVDFKKFVAIHAEFVDTYEAGTFKKSGTMVATNLICLDSAESVQSKLEDKRYQEDFYHFMVGNMGGSVRRDLHKNLSPEEYFNKIIAHSFNNPNYTGGIHTDINKEECIALIKEHDNDGI